MVKRAWLPKLCEKNPELWPWNRKHFWTAELPSLLEQNRLFQPAGAGINIPARLRNAELLRFKAATDEHFRSLPHLEDPPRNEKARGIAALKLFKQGDTPTTDTLDLVVTGTIRLIPNVGDSLHYSRNPLLRE